MTQIYSEGGIEMNMPTLHHNSEIVSDIIDDVVTNPTCDSLAVNVREHMKASIHDEVLKAAEAPTEAEVTRQARIEALKTMSVSVHDDIPADVNTLRIKGVETMAYEGLHFVKAKAKGGKSSMLSILEAVYIGQSGRWPGIERLSSAPLKVRHIDTEQKLYDTQSFKCKVLRMAGLSEEEAGDNYGIINMRRLVDNQEKKLLVETLLEEDRPDVLVLDGIVDFIDNFNEIDESKQLIAWLMHIADVYRVVLFCVLHTNKSSMDHNMRGHLGTMSEQKCDTTTECEKEEKSSIVSVKCTCSRHRPYSEWNFTWDGFGNLIDAEEQRAAILRQHAEEQKAEREKQAAEVKESRKQVMLGYLQSKGGYATRAELTEYLSAEFEKSRQTISPLISTWIKEEVIYENGKMVQLTPQSPLFTDD